MPRTPDVLAAEEVPMWAACLAIGMEIPRGLAGGSKQFCPFGDVWHFDGGREPAFRIYRDHAFCFACWRWWSPPSLCADAWDVTLELAAARLLDETGFRPPDYLERYERAVIPDRPELPVVAEALRVWCEGEAGRDWESLRIDPVVSGYLGACLGYLGGVATDEQASQWLSLAQQILGPAIADGRRRREAVRCPGA